MSASFRTKVYAVLDPQGRLLDVKLTFAAAHEVSRTLAPSSVTMLVADKYPAPSRDEGGRFTDCYRQYSR